MTTISVSNVEPSENVSPSTLVSPKISFVCFPNKSSCLVFLMLFAEVDLPPDRAAGPLDEGQDEFTSIPKFNRPRAASSPRSPPPMTAAFCTS